jgi:hypothetical protein
MPSAECKPECRVCGRPIDTENEECIDVSDGKVHLECESEIRDEDRIKKKRLTPLKQL